MVVGLPVCVNGFRKFMQLPLSKQDKQPTPSLSYEAPIHPSNYQYPGYVEQPYLVQHYRSCATINTQGPPPSSPACYIEQPYNASTSSTASYNPIDPVLAPVLLKQCTVQPNTTRTLAATINIDAMLLSAFSAPTAPNPCHSVGLPCI